MPGDARKFANLTNFSTVVRMLPLKILFVFQDCVKTLVATLSDNSRKGSRGTYTKEIIVFLGVGFRHVRHFRHLQL